MTIQIAIIVEGGVVQDVLTASGETVEFVLVDYDTDGDDGEAVPVLQDDGGFADAFVSKGEAQPLKNKVDALFAIAESEGP